MVATSYLQTLWTLDFLVGFNCAFLARRSRMAWQTIQLANSRWTVYHFFGGLYRGSDSGVKKAIWTFRIPTAGHWGCDSNCCNRDRFPGAAFNSIRFWRLH